MSWRVCWEPNLGTLQELQGPLASEPSLQPLILSSYTFLSFLMMFSSILYHFVVLLLKCFLYEYVHAYVHGVYMWSVCGVCVKYMWCVWSVCMCGYVCMYVVYVCIMHYICVLCGCVNVECGCVLCVYTCVVCMYMYVCVSSVCPKWGFGLALYTR